MGLIFFYSSACSYEEDLTVEEEALLEKLKQQAYFSEDYINDEQFDLPFYFVYLDGEDIGGIKRTKKLKEAKTIVFVKTGQDQLGYWVDSRDRRVGSAYTNYVGICLFDVNDHNRKRVCFGESYPGDVQGKGSVYIDGEKYPRSSSHYGKKVLLGTLLKTVIRK
jgi:hypothetical protein